MEIDIPDLDNVEFEQGCPCRWRGPQTGCKECHDSQVILTEVGKKLVKFLEARGVSLAPLPKVKE